MQLVLESVQRADAFRWFADTVAEQGRVAREGLDSRVHQTLKAMRADCVPVGERGLWEVRRGSHTAAELQILHAIKSGPTVLPGVYTQLRRHTFATMHAGGECVMNDYRAELRTHLEFCLRARGRVLVTGLGLGCVIRGLLKNPDVTRVDVVERDLDVIRLVWDAVRTPKVTLHHCDALEFARTVQPGRWDCAWHDLWSDPDANERHLDVLHVRLLRELRDKIPLQGAWKFDRRIKRPFSRILGGIIG
jgi:hypothetical protein